MSGKKTLQDIKNDDIKKHDRLVRLLAKKLVMRLPPNIEYDDMLQAGRLGLCDALRLYDPANAGSVMFETFASSRIYGAMLDELRKLDHLSRASRSFKKAYDSAKEKLFQKHHREPLDVEIAELLGMSIDELYENAKRNIVILDGGYGSGDSARGGLMRSQAEGDSFNDLIEGMRDNSAGPDELLEMKRDVNGALNVLKKHPRLLQIVELHIDRDLTFEEIAKMLSITSSRVAQLFKDALDKIAADREVRNTVCKRLSSRDAAETDPYKEPNVDRSDESRVDQIDLLKAKIVVEMAKASMMFG